MKTSSSTIKPTRDSVYSYKGRNVRVIAVDSDPRATVWVIYVDDPDCDEMVNPAELKPAQA